MNNLKVDKKMVVNRVDMIEKYLARLLELKNISKGEFAREDKYYFDTACYNLRSALEAIFDIIQSNLGDIEEFLKYIKKFLKTA